MATQNKVKPSIFVSKVTPTSSPKENHLNTAPEHGDALSNDHGTRGSSPPGSSQSQGQSTHVECAGISTVTNGK